MFSAYAYLSAYDRHKKLINDYLTLRGGSVSSLKRDTYVKFFNQFLYNNFNIVVNNLLFLYKLSEFFNFYFLKMSVENLLEHIFE